MKKKLLSLLVALFFIGCANVDITKTSKGFYEPTNPNEIEILLTKPDKAFIELGSVTVSDFDPSETATMHNAIRSKSAPLGADAVIILNQGIGPYGWLWATGVCIKYK
jgi:hypothetical protein